MKKQTVKLKRTKLQRKRDALSAAGEAPSRFGKHEAPRGESGRRKDREWSPPAIAPAASG